MIEDLDVAATDSAFIEAVNEALKPSVAAFSEETAVDPLPQTLPNFKCGKYEIVGAHIAAFWVSLDQGGIPSASGVSIWFTGSADFRPAILLADEDARSFTDQIGLYAHLLIRTSSYSFVRDKITYVHRHTDKRERLTLSVGLIGGNSVGLGDNGGVPDPNEVTDFLAAWDNPPERPRTPTFKELFGGDWQERVAAEQRAMLAEQADFAETEKASGDSTDAQSQ